MICVAALIVFAVLAIFSAKYRPLAKEAFSCVFLKLRLRPCQSGLDRRVRMAVVMPFADKMPRFAKFLHKYFSVFSTIFVVLTILSFGYMIYGGVNYALYGNCNGPGSTGFCIFDPNGPQTSETGECTEQQQVPEALIEPLPSNLTGLKVFHSDAEFTVVFFGCYSCPYTREAAPAMLASIEKHQDVRFVLVDFPIDRHENATLAANAGNCIYDQNPAAYLLFAQQLYTANLSQGIPPAQFMDPATQIDTTALNTCMAQPHPRTLQGIALGKQTGVYGTPTYFIGNKPVVGPLNKRSLERLIKQEQNK